MLHLVNQEWEAAHLTPCFDSTGCLSSVSSNTGILSATSTILFGFGHTLFEIVVNFLVFGLIVHGCKRFGFTFAVEDRESGVDDFRACVACGKMR